MIPVKLLLNNQKILEFIEEDSLLDESDYLEREVLNGSEVAKKLLAIENATEIAKRFIQRHYIDILKAIRAESKIKTSKIFRCKTVKNLSKTDYDVEFNHVEKELDGEQSGHAMYMKVDNVNKTIHLWDSMGEGAYLNEFEDAISLSYPGYKIFDESKSFQPMGGFIQDGPEEFALAMNISKNSGYVKRAWHLSQYDELSQHHFCYIEAFVAMMFDNIPMKRVGPDDARERLRFIKKVVWGLIHKFYTGRRDDDVWNYFTSHFPFYMTTWNTDGTKMKMKDGIFQIPTSVKYITRVDMFKTVDTSEWSLKDILEWAAKS